MQEIYDRLAFHLSTLGMGLPVTEDLLPILKENLTTDEAEILLLLPTKVGPLEMAGIDEINRHAVFNREKARRDA